MKKQIEIKIKSAFFLFVSFFIEKPILYAIIEKNIIIKEGIK